MNLRLGLVLFVTCSLSLPSLAAPPPARQNTPQIKRLPWHLVDTRWKLGESRLFQSYSVEVTVSADVPPSVSLYIAPLLGYFNKTLFYGGLQTHVYTRSRAEETRRQVGPGFIFSMWDERSLEAIRASEGGLCESSGHEGDFVGVRRAFAWKKGTVVVKKYRTDG
ncbi:hypothetical protein AGMMS50256_01700 [Betaproteobacteria bacterium]|nr:hypothetical protein AGMMS50256_01700 [Betaproteobacteria bacterium]